MNITTPKGLQRAVFSMLGKCAVYDRGGEEQR